MKNFLQNLFRSFSKPPPELHHERPPTYERHPQVTTLGEALFPVENAREPKILNEVASFLWKQLEIPRTEEALVSALTREFAVDARQATSDIRAFLKELLDENLVVTTGSLDPALPAARLSRSDTLLLAAYDRQKAGDWRGALSLCVEARHEAESPEIVELNVLICRHHLGSVEAVAGQALSLAPRLPGLAQIACFGLVMASAHRAGDLGATKTIACELARRVSDPWDLPTLPTFVYRAGERLIVMEDLAVDAFVEMIRSAQAGSVNTPEEAGLLNTLSQRYAERKAA